MNNSIKLIYNVWILLSVICIFSSCSTRYQNALFTSKSDLNTDTITTVHVVNSKNQVYDYYRIKPNDMLAIRNLQDISFISSGAESKGSSGITTFRVENDGGVILPVIGKVSVEGLSRLEASNKIQSLYKQNLLKDPIIELTVVNLKVTLLGEFNGKGNFLLEKENTSLIDIIGMAGGLSPRANPKSLKIIRGDRSNPEIIYVNLTNINSLANPKLILQNNDILYIEPLAVYNISERFQRISTLLQPVLFLMSTAILIISFTK